MSGSAKRRDQRSEIALGGANTISPASVLRLASVAGLSSPSFTPNSHRARNILQRTVEIDRPLISGLAQQLDHALSFAEPIGADHMGAFGNSERDLSSLAISSLALPCRNTGSANVASVTKRSQGTSSNGAQVGSLARL